MGEIIPESNNLTLGFAVVAIVVAILMVLFFG